MVEPLNNLATYLSVRRADYDRCLDVLQHALVVNGVAATLRLHYLKFNAAGQPMIPELAECLARQAVDYCLSARRRQDLELLPQSRQRMIEQARGLFRRVPTSGEAGELLLYFLQEAVLGAPQLVSKISLKTNPALETNGSDGIHGLWDAPTNTLDLFFGESKVYQQLAGALTDAFTSLERFHATEMLKHEIPMVSSQFKYLDEPARLALLQHLEGGVPGNIVRINHSLLIGHDWNAYTAFVEAGGQELLNEFTAAYSGQATGWRDLLQTRFDGFSKRDLRFEVFMLPFKNVQDFRNEFNLALDQIT